jgi:hypothetical protein
MKSVPGGDSVDNKVQMVYLTQVWLQYSYIFTIKAFMLEEDQVWCHFQMNDTWIRT